MREQLTKCTFMKLIIEYLGYNKDGIKLSSSKLQVKYAR